jgi:serine-aspartate repeat-containing protein C/D/E
VSTPTSTTTTTSVQTDTATTTPTPTDTIEPETGSISGTVFFDGYGSGAQDENEPGLEDTEVQLTNNDTERTLRTTTNSSGGFEFTNLSAGTYTLEPLKSTVPDWMSLDPENGPVNFSLERGGSSTAKFCYRISLNLTTTPSANSSENSTEAGR